MRDAVISYKCGTIGDDLGLEVLRGTHTRDVRTRCGEVGKEFLSA